MEKGLGFNYKRREENTGESRASVEAEISNILEMPGYGISSKDSRRFGMEPE